jgi:sulfate adenylyltransferase subunit 2
MSDRQLDDKGRFVFMNLYLKNLEKKSIYVLREARMRFGNMAIVWLPGKNSTTCLYLCRKAFFGKIPFPVIYIGKELEFQETYEFRCRIAQEWKIDFSIFPVQSNAEKFSRIVGGIEERYGVDALIITMKRDESLKWFEKDFSGGSDYILKSGDIFCVFPLVFWTEMDIWQYIEEENIPVNPLYFAKDGKRYRDIGYPDSPVQITSNSKTITEIIEELKTTHDVTEIDRAQDEEKDIIFQRLRDLGYL